MDTREDITREPKRPEAIRADIERTRSELDQTLGEISERVSTEHIKGQVREAVSARASALTSKAKRIGSDAAERVWTDPLPYILIGAGIASAAIGALRLGKDHNGNGFHLPDEEYDASYLEEEPVSESGEGASDLRSKAADRASEIKAKTVELAAGVKAKTAELAERGRDKAAEVAERGKQKARELGEAARERSSAVAERVSKFNEDNPLALGLAFLLFGCAVGLLIPSTRYERRLMGSTRDAVFERAEKKVGTLVHSAEDKVESMIENA